MRRLRSTGRLKICTSTLTDARALSRHAAVLGSMNSFHQFLLCSMLIWLVTRMITNDNHESSRMMITYDHAPARQVTWSLSFAYIFLLNVFQGYALIEYETRNEAQAAITAMNGKEMLEKTLGCVSDYVEPCLSPSAPLGASDRSAFGCMW